MIVASIGSLPCLKVAFAVASREIEPEERSKQPTDLFVCAGFWKSIQDLGGTYWLLFYTSHKLALDNCLGEFLY